MALTHDEVVHLAKLSKLSLASDEIDHFTDQLTPVLDYFRELNEIDTSNVSETSQTTGLVDVLRTDEIKAENVLTQESAISEASKTHNGFFVVPAILDKTS